MTGEKEAKEAILGDFRRFRLDFPMLEAQKGTLIRVIAE